MSEIARRFEFSGNEIRTVLIDGEPWFVARDVSAALGLANGRMAVARLDDDEKGVSQIDTPGGLQNLAVVSEAGLYDLIVRSDKPEAKPFRRWITHEVLPALRKTGRYAVEQHEVPRTLPEALRQYANEVEAHERTRAQLAITAPKADAWDTLASAEGDMSVREAAFCLNRDPNISTGQNRLFNTLKEMGWIDKRKVPYASHERHVRLRVYPFEDAVTGEKRTAQQVRVTAEGLRLLHKRLGGMSPLSHLMPVDPPAA